MNKTTSTRPNQPRLRQTLHLSLGRMLARCLDRAPAADDLPRVVDVYHDDLVDHGLRDEDAHRVAAALAKAGRMAERWPRPREVILNLPRRRPPHLAKLEHTDADPEQARAAFQEMRRILGSKVVNHG